MFLGNIYKVGFATERNYSFISECFNDFGTPTNFENVFNTYNQYIDYDAGQYLGASSYFWDYILDGGSINSYPTQKLIEHVASYTLSPNNYFDTFALDIDIDGYWEDHIPLSYFAKYVTNAKNESYYDLDFIQFNLNYPAPSKFVEKSKVGPSRIVIFLKAESKQIPTVLVSFIWKTPGLVNIFTWFCPFAKVPSPKFQSLLSALGFEEPVIFIFE
jgi:hypothetical protein